MHRLITYLCSLDNDIVGSEHEVDMHDTEFMKQHGRGFV